jgi:hypothetical protein
VAFGRAPSIIQSNEQQTTMVTTDDVFNTCMQLAQVKNQSSDGVTILPLLQGNKMVGRNYYLHFQHYSPQHGKQGAVVRSGNYRLVEWYEDGKLEWYDLSKDEGE